MMDENRAEKTAVDITISKAEKKYDKKTIARRMKEKCYRAKNDYGKYFDFYDDVKDRTRGHEDW